MKLHAHPFSTFSRRVRIALLEKDIACEIVDLDLAGKANRQPAYLALNPYGRVPTLVDGDLVLYESASILTYLEAKHPTPPLLPATMADRARADMHVRLCDLQMARHTSTVVFPKRFLPEARWDKPAIEAAQAEIARHLAILEPQLAGREWLVGDAFSLVEVAYAPLVHFLPLIDVPVGPAVARWVAAIAARPSVKATVPAK